MNDILQMYRIRDRFLESSSVRCLYCCRQNPIGSAPNAILKATVCSIYGTARMYSITRDS